MKWTTMKISTKTLELVKESKSKLYLKKKQECTNNEVMQLALKKLKGDLDGRRKLQNN